MCQMGAYPDNIIRLTGNVQIIIKEWIDRANELGWEISEPKGRLKYA